MRREIFYSIAVLRMTAASSDGAQALAPKEQLGKSIFFDRNLSINNNQSCRGIKTFETCSCAND